MESLNLADSDRRLCIMRLAMTVGLAMLSVAVLLCTVKVTPARAIPSTLYVDGASGNDTAGCTNPISPCATISYALSQAGDGDTILVAQGTYTENLVITKTVTLEGAYESAGWSRCLDRCTTTIDGNQSGRVIEVQTTLSETTVIDGFTITNGDKGVCIGLSSVAIQNSRVVHNHTTNWGAAGMVIDHSFVTITNTLIANNTDGAILIMSTVSIPGPYSSLIINGSTIADNCALPPLPGCNGIFCSLSACVVVNSIVWGHGGEDFSGNNYYATFSDTEMGLPGEGNISEDPRFVAPANGDYHLRPDSPCVDAGTNGSTPEMDFEGDPRPLNGDLYGPIVTDMGMDEFHMGMNPFQTVLAAYQAWHGLPSHAPAPYTSTDPIAISNHITAAKAQGIDGFVVDWYGPPDGLLNDRDREFIDRATAELLQQAEGRRFYVAIMYDEGTVRASGVPAADYQTRVISDLLYARRYYTMSSYLMVNRRPAIFIFAYDNVDPYIDWAEVRNQLGITVTLFDRDPNPGDPARDTQFDGFYAWVQPTGGQWSPLCTEWGEGYLIWFYNTMATAPYTDKVTIGGVWPGFDDSLASWGSGRCMSRRCGQTWRDTWNIADQYDPPIVMINTWNDFEEDTDVEFGIEYCIYLPLVTRGTPVATISGKYLPAMSICALRRVSTGKPTFWRDLGVLTSPRTGSY